MKPRYGDRSGQHVLPIHLAARASTMIDIGMLIAMGQPNANGNLIPNYIQEGSVVFSNPKGRAEPRTVRYGAEWMTVAVCGALYNPRKATCEEICTECDGYSAFAVVENPYTVAVNGTVQLYAQATYPDGTVYEFTTSSSWSSSNTAVATVGESTGLVTGVWPGSAQIGAQFPSLVSTTEEICATASGLACPVVVYEVASSGSTTPTVTVTCSPSDLALGSTAPASTKSGNCSTTASPAGGTFSWSVSKTTVTLNGSGGGPSYTAASQSSASGDTSITVQYTVNGQSATAQSAGITVHKPTTLEGGSVEANGSSTCTLACLANPGAGNCNVTQGTSCSYSANQFQREYKVFDQFGTFFQDFGINNATVTESVTITSNNCAGSGVQTGSSSYTDFFDNYGKCDSCCEQGGPGCTTTAAQTIYVNGYSLFNTNITVTCTTATVSP